ncbi:uncharacterized protein Z518_00795 [Rhinocladiella mackenziei CBS 650.93]|uniref:Early meiotic induction protein 1 n=1 Tax=Rhinocladiella mackenziei CBS 650.93 TaxID=1442369 RepID=A0A0D2IUG8_9EURO|nr:uncharacterized protein Z518_00795 [Rhinocladiella mackenziei CBS 650.93]KIX09714.1 hypothetical protein Z518_00795 [Rhinocladiella mackenziei CBS 650.93]
MGWWWNSKPAASGENPLPSSSTQNEEPSPPAAAEPIAEPVKRTLSPEEQSNLELMELLKEFEAQSNAEQDQRTRAKEPGALKQSVPIPADISPDSLYPTEMSCQSAFDYAMFCQGFGGQFVNIYRYGSFRSCSNHWEDFWLCMRTRNWDKQDRAKAIQDHYRKKAVQWKTGPSSEDVWEVREHPVKDAFQGNLEELEARIAEWQKANPDRTASMSTLSQSPLRAPKLDPTGSNPSNAR